MTGLGLACWCATATAAGQSTPRAATVLEWEGTDAPVVSSVTDAAVAGAGYEIIAHDQVSAALAFSGGGGALDDARAEQLRVSLGASLLVVVSVREGEGSVRYVAVRMRLADGPRAGYAEAEEGGVVGVVARLLARLLVSRALPGPVAVEAVEPVAVEAVGPVAVETVGPVAVEAVAIEAVAVEAVAVEAVAVESAAVEPVETPVYVSRDAMRTRVMLTAIAGINGYGYGAGLRLDLPFISPLSGTDDSLSVVFDAGVTFDYLSFAQAHNLIAVQIPAAATLSWRFSIGDLELGPRLGGAIVTRFGIADGERVTGWRLDLFGYALVGFHMALRIDRGAQFFFGADVAMGVRFSGVLAVGVAL